MFNLWYTWWNTTSSILWMCLYTKYMVWYKIRLYQIDLPVLTSKSWHYYYYYYYYYYYHYHYYHLFPNFLNLFTVKGTGRERQFTVMLFISIFFWNLGQWKLELVSLDVFICEYVFASINVCLNFYFFEFYFLNFSLFFVLLVHSA